MMKRIAALTALVITLLAVPAAAAMATTGGPGPGPGYAKPTPVQLVCARIHHFPRVYVIRHHKRIPVRIRIRIACPLRGKPFPRPCLSGVLRFDMAAGGRTLTEVSGPTLAPAQEFNYDGSTYTIMSVNPGANSFTVVRDGFLFVNSGAAITNAVALMACAR
jgi:hypothetical protein